MRLIYSNDGVGIQSKLGEVCGASLLHYAIAKTLFDMCPSDNVRESQDDSIRVITMMNHPMENNDSSR